MLGVVADLHHVLRPASADLDRAGFGQLPWGWGMAHMAAPLACSGCGVIAAAVWHRPFAGWVTCDITCVESRTSAAA